MSKIFEIRDPIHGFITVNEWEKAVIDHLAFTRAGFPARVFHARKRKNDLLLCDDSGYKAN